MRFTLSLISVALLAVTVSAAPASVAEEASISVPEEFSVVGLESALARLRGEVSASASFAQEASVVEFASAESVAPENILQKRYEHDDDDDEDDDDEDDDDEDDDDEDDDDEDDEDEDDEEHGHGHYKKKKIWIWHTVTAEPLPTITVTTTTGTETVSSTSTLEETVTETTSITRLLSLPFLTVV